MGVLTTWSAPGTAASGQSVAARTVKAEAEASSASGPGTSPG
jgi:hypothetical protein